MKAQQLTRYSKTRHVIKVCGFLVLFSVLAPSLLPYRWNGSASVPIGFYRVSQGEVELGSLVAFCLPKEVAVYAKERGYINFGWECPGWTQRLLKPVVAIEGDTVVVAPEGVAIREHAISNTVVFELDSQGREHRTWITPGRYVIPADQVFVLSTFHERSWDSRYYGFIHRKDIVYAMEPVWTW